MRMQDVSLQMRHPEVKHLARMFAFDHLPQGEIRDTSALCASLAAQMIHEKPDGPELIVGLRKLLEAKDAFVRCEVYRADPTGEFVW